MKPEHYYFIAIISAIIIAVLAVVYVKYKKTSMLRKRKLYCQYQVKLIKHICTELDGGDSDYPAKAIGFNISSDFDSSVIRFIREFDRRAGNVGKPITSVITIPDAGNNFNPSTRFTTDCDLNLTLKGLDSFAMVNGITIMRNLISKNNATEANKFFNDELIKLSNFLKETNLVTMKWDINK